jgi:hypothetical protein
MGTVGGFVVNVESFKGSFVSSSLNHKIARLQKRFSATNALDYKLQDSPLCLLLMTLKSIRDYCISDYQPFIPYSNIYGHSRELTMRVEASKDSFVSASLNLKMASLKKCFGATNVLDYKLQH